MGFLGTKIFIFGCYRNLKNVPMALEEVASSESSMTMKDSYKYIQTSRHKE